MHNPLREQLRSELHDCTALTARTAHIVHSSGSGDICGNGRQQQRQREAAAVVVAAGFGLLPMFTPHYHRVPTYSEARDRL